MTVTKRYKFEAAHRLMNHPGHCKNLHGHSYKIVVTVGNSDDLNDQGMVIDFSELSKVVKEEVIDKFDHAVILNSADPLAEALVAFTESEPQNDMCIVLLDEDPTAEYMAMAFAAMIDGKLKDLGVRVLRMEVWETETAFAAWDVGLSQ